MAAVAPTWRAAVKLGRCKRDWEILGRCEHGDFLMGDNHGILRDFRGFFWILSDVYRIKWGFVVKIVGLFNVVYSHLWESNWDCDNGDI